MAELCLQRAAYGRLGLPFIFVICTKPVMKNRYHPLVKIKFFLGILSHQEVSFINTRTLYSWNHVRQNELVGYNPNDPLISEKELFVFLHDQKHVRSMLKVYKSLFACFKNILFSVRSLDKIMRKQKTVLIDAYSFCKEYISSQEFKLLTGISPKKILRWQNEILCQNSFFLRLCLSLYRFFSHMHSLFIYLSLSFYTHAFHLFRKRLLLSMPERSIALPLYLQYPLPYFPTFPVHGLSRQIRSCSAAA